MFEQWRIARPILLGIIELLPIAELFADRSLMEPGLGKCRSREERAVNLREQRVDAVETGFVVFLERFRIQLLDHAETAELPLRAIPVAVVVAILGRQLAVR